MSSEVCHGTGLLLRLIDELLQRTHQKQIDQAITAAAQDVESFKNDLLERRLHSLNLRLSRLQHGILVHVTAAEAGQLHALQPGLDGFALLGLYARARAADLAGDVR